MVLLPIRAAVNFIRLKLNVNDDDIPLLIAIKKLEVTQYFPNNQMWTPEKGFKLNRSSVGHRIWRMKVDQQKQYMKQRINKEQKIY